MIINSKVEEKRQSERMAELLSKYVSLTYCASLGRLSAKEHDRNHEILSEIAHSDIIDKGKIRARVEELCDAIMNAGDLQPYTDQYMWDTILSIKEYFGIKHDMLPSRKYFM